jgi:hypothetical protein
MKGVLLAAFVTHGVFGSVLHRRQASPFGSCDPRDACVGNVGLPEDYSFQAYTDCAAHLEHTTTVAGLTFYTTLSASDGSYTTTSTVGWCVTQIFLKSIRLPF